MNRKKINNVIVILIILAVLCCCIILCPGLSWAQVLDWEEGGRFEKGGNEGISGFFGWLALLFFIIANLYTPSKWIIKHKVIHDTQVLKKNLRNLFHVHIQCNVLMFIFALIHAHNASQGNIFLVLAMIIFAWLIVGGSLMKSKLNMHKDFRKYVQILHTQQILFWVAIVLLFVGHALMG